MLPNIREGSCAHLFWTFVTQPHFEADAQSHFMLHFIYVIFASIKPKTWACCSMCNYLIVSECIRKHEEQAGRINQNSDIFTLLTLLNVIPNITCKYHHIFMQSYISIVAKTE